MDDGPRSPWVSDLTELEMEIAPTTFRTKPQVVSNEPTAAASESENLDSNLPVVPPTHPSQRGAAAVNPVDLPPLGSGRHFGLPLGPAQGMSQGMSFQTNRNSDELTRQWNPPPLGDHHTAPPLLPNKMSEVSDIASSSSGSTGWGGLRIPFGGRTIARCRELFAGFIGVTLAFTTINLVFANVTGGCLILFGLLSGVWCFVDRHHTTYTLNGFLQVLLAITISIAVATYFPGFDNFSTDPFLRTISLAHIPLAFLFGALSFLLAFKDQASHPERRFATVPPAAMAVDPNSEVHSEK